MSLHDEIRRIATDKFVGPARERADREFPIAVKALMKAAEAEGISTAQRTPAFCTAIQTRDFLDQAGVERVRIDGPDSKKSTTVVVWYRFRDAAGRQGIQVSSAKADQDPLLELTGVLRGAIREGAASFLRELRRDETPKVEVDARKSA